jgi:hypothetical protein
MTEKSGLKRGRFFPWLYYAKNKDLGKRSFSTQIHKIRDGLAVLEAAQVFNACGYMYGGSILNIPQPIKDFLGSKVRRISVSLSAMDVVFMPTRPPLDDVGEAKQAKKSRKPILKSGTELEASIVENLRLAFKLCRRDEIVLADELSNIAKSPHAEEYRAIKFQQYNGGCVEQFCGKSRRSPKERNLAVGYLVSVSGVAPGGFQLIASFGAGGTETLWFNFLLRTSHRQYLHQALKTQGVHVWMLPFLTPNWVPTLLTCLSGELEPKVECGKILEWSRMSTTPVAIIG